jgi:hypothetical protein
MREFKILERRRREWLGGGGLEAQAVLVVKVYRSQKRRGLSPF